MINEENYKHTELTRKIIKAFYEVYNRLGHGFLEKVYENSMVIELKKAGLLVEKQKQITVYYDGFEVGMYFADILVDNKVMVELKAAESLCKEHEAQLTNYLRATDIEVGLLLNFGETPEISRKAFSNSRKKNHNDHKDQLSIPKPQP